MFDYYSKVRKMEDTVSKIEMLSMCSIEVLLDKLAAGWKLTPPSPEQMSLEKLCEDVSEDDSPKKKTYYSVRWDRIIRIP